MIVSSRRIDSTTVGCPSRGRGRATLPPTSPVLPGSGTTSAFASETEVTTPVPDAGTGFGGDAPPEVVNVAVRAAQLIGEGLYGVDLKETEQGVIIIEINDNPSIDHDVEGQILKDEIWRRIISWFSTRLERRMNHSG